VGQISYAEQLHPAGLAQALIIAEEFVGTDSAMLVLGDNIFHGHGFRPILERAIHENEGATIFAHHVQNPARYGVVTFDGLGDAISIEEKPLNPTSPWAVVGLYIYDNKAARFAKALTPSARGELEITDLNATYLRAGQLKVVQLGRGFAWFDTGLPESLHDAASYVATLEKRQGLKIACPEEIAYRLGYISPAQVSDLVTRVYSKSEYGDYLRRMLADG
jgi:glucose-1-phosphate thymidylyltransferase